MKTQSATNALELGKKMKLKAVLVDIMSNMPIVNVDGVLSVANTLSSVTSNTSEINLASAV